MHSESDVPPGAVRTGASPALVLQLIYLYCCAWKRQARSRPLYLACTYAREAFCVSRCSFVQVKLRAGWPVHGLGIEACVGMRGV